MKPRSHFLGVFLPFDRFYPEMTTPSTFLAAASEILPRARS